MNQSHRRHHSSLRIDPAEIPPRSQEIKQNTRQFFAHITVPARMCLLAADPLLGQAMSIKTETFKNDPAWDAHNNRPQTLAPRQITQNFEYSSGSTNTGEVAGEIGGLITPASKPAYYAQANPVDTLINNVSGIPQAVHHGIVGLGTGSPLQQRYGGIELGQQSVINNVTTSSRKQNACPRVA